ncbi:peptide-N4-(N-acetyl-beta-glucosaminyl)asparagine amidase A-like [Phalaenopsis equestris]|uniref:peptide-N4-(N-acetyl-beta- glucosaminyl)asparagine amidase A-like n=1 Tax=Phalaenopsis equestris TaxID=78828 RepID=UPI0009E3571A|nr:peptide-N4-(N-acetyl-beta-glucosaminyl)asparagine amidase A-like [Phalaenopsis equestris]
MNRCCISVFLLLLSVGIVTQSAGPVPSISLEHLDPTLPPAILAGQTPKCSVLLLQQEFADTAGSLPAAANYTHPRECPFPWTRVILELSVSASDLQRDRIAAVWIDGSEILRTTTPLPMAPGAFWTVRKDVSRYAAILRRLGDPSYTAARGRGIVSMMLENSNSPARLPGVYSANVSLHFYRGAATTTIATATAAAHPNTRSLYHEPADIILPISNPTGYLGTTGFWFRINNETHIQTSPIALPMNAYRAVLEIFVSYHGDDEFWYTNPLRTSYLRQSPFSNLSSPRTNGGFRQLYATIDGQFVGGHIPFPVIYPRSINPFFWSPVASIGAFDMPSYDLDITPFLGLLLDGRTHEIGLGVRDALPYWLVSGNLHVWVDLWSDAVRAGLVHYYVPPVKVNRNAEWRNQDGQSEINAEGLWQFTGWVSSSRGNISTAVRQKIKFKSQIEVQNRGAVTQVEVNNKERMMVEMSIGHQTLGRAQMLLETPLQIQTTSVSAAGGSIFLKARLFHQLLESVVLSQGQAMTTSTLTDRQDAEGSALMRGDAPVWGSASTRSSYKYRDDNTCYLRAVNTAGGVVMLDTTSPSCAADA